MISLRAVAMTSCLTDHKLWLPISRDCFHKLVVKLDLNPWQTLSLASVLDGWASVPYIRLSLDVVSLHMVSISEHTQA